MACPSGSEIHLLGIARENLYDNYADDSELRTNDIALSIFDLVVGGDDGGSGIEIEDKNDIGGYGGLGDPPGNEVSFSHFWGYNHDETAPTPTWTDIFSNISDMEALGVTWESSEVTAQLDDGVASNIDITSNNSDHKVKYRFTAGGTWSSYAYSHLNVDWSAYDTTKSSHNKIYLMFSRDMPPKEPSAGTSTIIVTDDSASNDASFSRTVSTESL